MALFDKKLGQRESKVGLNGLVQQVRNLLNSTRIVSKDVASAGLALESLNDSQRQMLKSSTDELSVSIESIAKELGMADTLTSAQKDAAVAAGVIAGDIGGFLRRSTKFDAVSTESVSVINYGNLENTIEARPALEAYNEQENKAAALYSIVYNMQAARQDDFGEAFFPTIVVTPDNVGFAVSVRLMMVYDELKRNISGALADFNKKNILRALADPTILKNEVTRVVPVVRPQSEEFFVPDAIVAPRNLNLEGEIIRTKPLAVGKRLDLLGLSQPDALLSNGLQDMTDTLEPAVVLTAIYVQVGDDVIKFNTSGLPYANFGYAVQENYRMMNMNFSTKSVLVNGSTTRVDGAPLVDLAGVATNDLIVRLSIDLTGKVNIETGETVVYGNGIEVYTVQDAAGDLLGKTDVLAAPIVAAIADAKIVGYDLQAYRSNANKRQRGQLIDTTEFTQLYNVPFRSPITALHPVTSDSSQDAGDLSTLVTTTRIRTSNAAVTALINAAAQLREYVDARDTLGQGPDVLGTGRYYVRPQFYEETIDMLSAVDSIKSHERAADIQAVLINKIRDIAYRLYRDSEYKAAADALSGGVSQVPTVILGTDPVIARYLQVEGELRTLSNEFKVEIVSTLDNRVAGKIFIAFGVFDESRNTEPNPLNFGNMAWSPEVTVNIPVSRDGGISKELSVAPRFLHVTHCPIMAVVSVENIPDVLNKVPVQFQEL